MIASTCGRLSICGHRSKSQYRSYDIDTTIALEINGTRQRVRLCGARAGLPPILIVQAGPGFPLLNEVAKFQQRLQLEESFAVAYWDQRGCGQAALQDTQNVSLETQVDDLCAVVRWLAKETRQRVVVLGISLGATIALQAAARDANGIKALVAVSIDADTSASDTSASSFLQEMSTQTDKRGIARLIKKLGAPPYITPTPFQLRARLLTDLGGMEHGKRFAELLRGLLFSLIRTYGWAGTVAALRNMNALQRKLLPELASLNLFSNWPKLRVPVHYIFGNSDPLVPRSLAQRVSGVITHKDTVVALPNAGHMVHFDEPAIVRSIIVQAHSVP
jgi:pimeloyl-ACP methyl ester carboxylesterase